MHSKASAAPANSVRPGQPRAGQKVWAGLTPRGAEHTSGQHTSQDLERRKALVVSTVDAQLRVVRLDPRVILHALEVLHESRCNAIG